MAWFWKKKEEPAAPAPAPVSDAAQAGMIANSVLVNPSDDEQIKADHFRMEHIWRYLKDKEEAGVKVAEDKLKFLLAEAKYLAAKIEFWRVKKEVENGNNNPS
jgi:hypothetical protein